MPVRPPGTSLSEVHQVFPHADQLATDGVQHQRQRVSACRAISVTIWASSTSKICSPTPSTIKAHGKLEVGGKEGRRGCGNDSGYNSGAGVSHPCSPVSAGFNRDNAHLDEAIAVIDRLLDRQPRSVAQEEYLSALTDWSRYTKTFMWRSVHKRVECALSHGRARVNTGRSVPLLAHLHVSEGSATPVSLSLTTDDPGSQSRS